MPVHLGQTLHFGPFSLDPHCGELRTNGSRIKLQGQPIQILELLLEKPGELITREEIRQKLWSSDTFVDFDHNLNTAVKKLRQALGDEADTPKYIETLPRYGYRFVGEVKQDDEPKAAVPVSEPTQPTETRTTSDARLRLASAIAISAIAVSTILTYYLLREPSRIPRVPVYSKVLLMGKDPLSPTISPDGHYLAYVAGNGQIWLKDLQGGTDEPLAGTERAHNGMSDPSLFWSPDGRYIGFFTATPKRTKKIALDSRIVSEITDFHAPYGAWGATGVILGSTSRGFVAISVASGEKRSIPSPPGWTDSLPNFLPDGKHFLFVRYQTGRYLLRGGSGVLFVGALDGSPPKSLDLRVAGYAKYAAGSVLYITESGLFARPFDGSKLRFLADPTLLVSSNGRDLTFTASSSGVLISGQGVGLTHGESELRLYSRKGQAISEPFAQGFPDQPRFSPDGKLIAYDKIIGESRDIWIYDIERRINTRVTPGDSFYFGPVWSPDGKRLAYTYGNQTTHGIIVQTMDAGTKPEIVFEHSNETTLNTWVRSWRSVDDCLFVTVTEFGGPRKVGVLCLNADRKLRVLPDEESTSRMAPMISPNGKWLAYNGVSIEPYPGPGQAIVVSPGGFPRWRRDGRELYFWTFDSVSAASLLEVGNDIKVGAINKLFSTPPRLGGVAIPLEASPDGQMFVLNTARLPQGPRDNFDLITNFDLLVKK